MPVTEIFTPVLGDGGICARTSRRHTEADREEAKFSLCDLLQGLTSCQISAEFNM